MSQLASPSLRRESRMLAGGLAMVVMMAFALRASAQNELSRLIQLNGPIGSYTTAQWKKDWPSCAFENGISDGRVTLKEADNERWLRVSYTPGQIGPAKGGAGWRYPVGSHEFAELTYSVSFSPDFDWVKGGKLPGLCGGPDNVSGGRPANGKNGFSARLMWRKDGRGEAYVYHKHQPTNYGESFAFPADFRFPTGQAVTVRMQVGMNAPRQRDGTLRVWITTPEMPSRLMMERTDLQWRDEATFAVDSLYFETFHGGGDSSWAPTRSCWAEFGGIRLAFPTALSVPKK